MFVDFCCGLLGGSYDQRMNSKLVRVIIAGDSLGSGPDDVSDLRDSWERNRVITLFTYYVHPLYNFRERYVINTLSNTLSTPTAHSRICVYDCDMFVCKTERAKMKKNYLGILREKYEWRDSE